MFVFKIANFRVPRKGGKENCQAAANPPLSSRKVMPGSTQKCMRKSVAPVNRRISVIRRVISPKPQTISPKSQAATPELNDYTKKVTRPFRRASVVVQKPQPDFMTNSNSVASLISPNQSSDKTPPGLERDACKRDMPRQMSYAPSRTHPAVYVVQQTELDLKFKEDLDSPVDDSSSDVIFPSNGAQANPLKKAVSSVPAKPPQKDIKPTSKDVAKSKAVLTGGTATKTKAPVIKGKGPVIRSKAPVIKSVSQANKPTTNNLKAMVTKNTSKTLTSNRKVSSAPPSKPPASSRSQKVSTSVTAPPTKPLSNSAKSVVPLAKSKKPVINPVKSVLNSGKPALDKSKPLSSAPPVKRPNTSTALPPTVRPNTRLSSAPAATAKVARHPATVSATKPPPFVAKPAPKTATVSNSKPPLFKPSKRKAKPEYSPAKILPGISKFLDNPNFVMKPMRAVSNFTPRSAASPSAAKKLDPEPSRLSGQLDSTEPEHRKHSRYSIETPSPSHHDNTFESDSDSDMDEHLKEKLRAHNKWVQDQAKAKKSGEEKSVVAPKFRRVTLHIGSPSRPRVNVKRRS